MTAEELMRYLAGLVFLYYDYFIYSLLVLYLLLSYRILRKHRIRKCGLLILMMFLVITGAFIGFTAWIEVQHKKVRVFSREGWTCYRFPYLNTGNSRFRERLFFPISSLDSFMVLQGEDLSVITSDPGGWYMDQRTGRWRYLNIPRSGTFRESVWLYDNENGTFWHGFYDGSMICLRRSSKEQQYEKLWNSLHLEDGRIIGINRSSLIELDHRSGMLRYIFVNKDKSVDLMLDGPRLLTGEYLWVKAKKPLGLRKIQGTTELGILEVARIELTTYQYKLYNIGFSASTADFPRRNANPFTSSFWPLDGNGILICTASGPFRYSANQDKWEQIKEFPLLGTGRYEINGVASSSNRTYFIPNFVGSMESYGPRRPLHNIITYDKKEKRLEEVGFPVPLAVCQVTIEGYNVYFCTVEGAVWCFNEAKRQWLKLLKGKGRPDEWDQAVLSMKITQTHMYVLTRTGLFVKRREAELLKRTVKCPSPVN
ncbi:MAG: hypothetical protein RDV48_31455 [Candidatus Eremiobacteraeota bacterium]|nr:hypothetical protein [Candidatus Eremiobacteraeota bacterium]